MQTERDWVQEVRDYKARYQKDVFWRHGWHRLAHKLDHGRLQTKQEYIESRGSLANKRIAKLMRDYDLLHPS